MAILTKDNDARVADLFNQFAGQKVEPDAKREHVKDTDGVIVSLKAEAAKHGFSVELYPLLDFGMTQGGVQDRLTVHFYEDHNGDVRIQNLELEDHTI